MYKAYKFRLYPNDEQIVLINKTFGSVRYTYNYYLDNAYQKMFNKQGGYPKFKSKYGRNSYNTVAVYSK